MINTNAQYAWTRGETKDGTRLGDVAFTATAHDPDRGAVELRSTAAQHRGNIIAAATGAEPFQPSYYRVFQGDTMLYDVDVRGN